MFERIIYDQFFKYLNDNHLLVNCQSGFRLLHSTLTSLLEASNSWSVNVDNGLINGVIFIHVDLKKAFDTKDHKILLRKLASYGIDHRALKWFDSYLSDRQQKCVPVVNKMVSCLVRMLLPVVSHRESLLDPFIS